MFEVVPFEPKHSLPLLKHRINSGIQDWYDIGYAEMLKENSSISLTGLLNNEPVFCSGIIELWEKRGYLWSVLGENIKPNSIRVYRCMKRLLYMSHFDRVEMDVPVENGVWHKRALFLGFHLEVPYAEKYLPDGSPAAIYAWVRK